MSDAGIAIGNFEIRLSESCGRITGIAEVSRIWVEMSV
jgi:hypothetical protein